MVDPRRFSRSQKAALYLAADGRCEECGAELLAGWHGDHVMPRVANGPTDVTNGQALCPACNLKKGSRTVDDLRPWQRQLHQEWLEQRPADALVCATPGAGKTYAALTLAKQLLDEGAVERVAVVVPTDALREQWAAASSSAGMHLMPVRDTVDYDKAGYDGCVATYQQLASAGGGGGLMRRAMRRRTLAILDEIHHAGDTKAWGDQLRYAVEPATHRLALTGTPWRQDQRSPIPFVEYVDALTRDGEPIRQPKVFFAYEYGQAVGDGVCRRVEFHAYDGQARWVDLGETQEADLGEDLDESKLAAVFDAVLDPRQPWIKSLLVKAAAALDDLRADVPHAGGLVVTDTQEMARAYHAILTQLTGEPPALAVHDDGPRAKADIESFRRGTSRWLVSVRMVSEGVDIPRLAVGVYATRWKTPLFFRQVVGRFVRVGSGGEYNSQLFIPSVPTLLRHAREIEDELRHELVQAEERERAERERAEGQQQAFDLRTILSTSDATFHSAILSGDELTADELERARQECTRWDIPAIYAGAVARMLRERAAPIDVVITPKVAEQPRHKVEALRRKELESLARRYAHKTGLSNQEVNYRLASLFGPRPKATLDSLDEQIQLVAKWISEL